MPHSGVCNFCLGGEAASFSQGLKWETKEFGLRTGDISASPTCFVSSSGTRSAGDGRTGKRNTKGRQEEEKRLENHLLEALPERTAAAWGVLEGEEVKLKGRRAHSEGLGLSDRGPPPSTVYLQGNGPCPVYSVFLSFPLLSELRGKSMTSVLVSKILSRENCVSVRSEIPRLLGHGPSWCHPRAGVLSFTI